jgi:hypothetical protein
VHDDADRGSAGAIGRPVTRVAVRHCHEIAEAQRLRTMSTPRCCIEELDVDVTPPNRILSEPGTWIVADLCNWRNVRLYGYDRSDFAGKFFQAILFI